MPLKDKVWGYLHVNGTIHRKRFLGIGDILEARESSFVVVTVGPFFDDMELNRALRDAKKAFDAGLKHERES